MPPPKRIQKLQQLPAIQQLDRRAWLILGLVSIAIAFCLYMAFGALTSDTRVKHGNPSPAFVEPAQEEITELAFAQKFRLPTDLEVKLLAATSSFARKIAAGGIELSDVSHYGNDSGLKGNIVRIRSILSQQPDGLKGSPTGVTLESVSGSEALTTVQIDFYDPKGSSAPTERTLRAVWKLAPDGSGVSLSELALSTNY